MKIIKQYILDKLNTEITVKIGFQKLFEWCAVVKIPIKICHAMCLPEGGSNQQNGPALRCTKIYMTFKVPPISQFRN